MAEFADVDAEFERKKKENPDLTYGEFYGREVVDQIKGGFIHPSLGGQLTKEQNWGVAGKGNLSFGKRVAGVTPQSKIVDYGCGTLRLGVHWIRYLEPKGYFGLDVLPDFLKIGRKLLGKDVVEEKKPKLGVVTDPADIARAISHNADMLFSHGVLHHIPPDELETYGGNVQAITHKPGAMALIGAYITTETVRVSAKSWAYTESFYQSELMPNMTLAQIHKRKPIEVRGHKMEHGVLEYRPA